MIYDAHSRPMTEKSIGSRGFLLERTRPSRIVMLKSARDTQRSGGAAVQETGGKLRSCSTDMNAREPDYSEGILRRLLVSLCDSISWSERKQVRSLDAVSKLCFCRLGSCCRGWMFVVCGRAVVIVLNIPHCSKEAFSLPRPVPHASNLSNTHVVVPWS